MSPKAIQVGKSYCNRGAGCTIRTVIGIGKQHKPQCWYGNDSPPKDGIGVQYTEKGSSFVGRLYLKSFAAWAGKEVK